MATQTLPNSLTFLPLIAEVLRPFPPQSEPQPQAYDGQLIDGLTRLVDKVQKPKPPQTVSPVTDQGRERKAGGITYTLKLDTEQWYWLWKYSPAPPQLADQVHPDVFPDQ